MMMTVAVGRPLENFYAAHVVAKDVLPIETNMLS
jgi:hypothetical protein